MHHSEIEIGRPSGLPDPVTSLPSGNLQLIQARFLERAAYYPDAVALVHEGESWTYGAVEIMSATLAHDLRQKGIGRGDCVVILAERRPELIWSIIAVLRLGAVFAVLDCAYPNGRLDNLISLCKPQAVIATTDHLVRRSADLTGLGGIPLALARERAATHHALAGGLDSGCATDPAYFLFTSGSTGSPKCVACNHVPLVNFVAWHSRTFGLTGDDTFAMLSGLSHDPVLRDIFTPLSIGATLAIPVQSSITEPGALGLWLADQNATVCHLTPSIGQLIVSGSRQDVELASLRYLFWGGDQLSGALVTKVKRIASMSSHVNFYGATETPQAASFFRCDEPGDGIVPIGKGTHGFQLLILDSSDRQLGVGEVGEIAVRSNFLSLGYVQHGIITAADDRIRDSLGQAAIYRTGDRGVYRPDGNVSLVGRADDQLKIRGYRVDLSEVTSALRSQKQVSSAIALAIEDGPRVRIDGFVAVDHPSPELEAHISQAISNLLPSYMLPSKIWLLQGTLPLLPNGKIDRADLKSRARSVPLTHHRHDLAEHEPISAAESALINKWASIFGESAALSRQTTFLSLGGDSLSYVDAYLAAEEIVGALPSNWTEMTVAQLAGIRRATHRDWSSIDTSMLIRAASIAIIVAYHFGLSSFGNGFTGALFVVSGYIFGGLQFKEALRTNEPRKILYSVGNLFLPTVIMTYLAILYDIFVKHFSLNFASLILSVDLIDQHFSLDSRVLGPNQITQLDGNFWYIDCVIHILLILYLVQSLIPSKRRGPDALVPFALTLFLAGCVCRFAFPMILANDCSEQNHCLSILEISPLSNLSTFTLGILATSAQTIRTRLQLYVLTIIFCLFNFFLFGPVNTFAIAAAVLTLTMLKRIYLPKTGAAIIFTLSGASLFIYTTHLVFGSAVQTITGSNWPQAKWVVALIGGVAVHAGWTWCRNIVRSKLTWRSQRSRMLGA